MAPLHPVEYIHRRYMRSTGAPACTRTVPGCTCILSPLSLHVQRRHILIRAYPHPLTFSSAHILFIIHARARVRRSKTEDGLGARLVGGSPALMRTTKEPSPRTPVPVQRWRLA